MRRILLVLSVAALMAAMMVAMAAPAIAQPKEPFNHLEPGQSGLLLSECDFGPTYPAVGHGTLVTRPSDGVALGGTCDEWAKLNRGR